MDENSHAGQTSHLLIDLLGNPSFGLAKWHRSVAFNISKYIMWCLSKFGEGVGSNIPFEARNMSNTFANFTGWLWHNSHGMRFGMIFSNDDFIFSTVDMVNNELKHL